MLLGALFLFARHRDFAKFEHYMNQARCQVMSQLSAAAMESYSRAYPSLVKLHKLYEIEKMCQLLQEDDVDQRQNLMKEWRWDVRLKLLTPSVSIHDEVLTSRRAAFRILGMTTERGETWLHAAKLARASGNIQLASAAVEVRVK